MSGNGPALLAAAAGVGIGHAILPDHWVPLAVLGRTRRYPLSRVARLSGLAGIAHVLVSIVLGGVVIAVGLQFRSAIESAQSTIVGCVLIATGVGFALLELSGRGHSHDGHGHSHGAHGHPHGGHGHGHEHAHAHGEDVHDYAHDAHGEHDCDHHAGHDHDPVGDRHEQGAHGHEHGAHGHERGSRGSGDPQPRGLRGAAAIMVPFGAAASPDLTILPVFLAATTAGVATAVGSLIVFAAVTIGTIVGLTVGAARGGYQIQGVWLERWGNAFTALVLVVIGVLVLTSTI